MQSLPGELRDKIYGYIPSSERESLRKTSKMFHEEISKTSLNSLLNAIYLYAFASHYHLVVNDDKKEIKILSDFFGDVPHPIGKKYERNTPFYEKVVEYTKQTFLPRNQIIVTYMTTDPGDLEIRYRFIKGPITLYAFFTEIMRNPEILRPTYTNRDILYVDLTIYADYVFIDLSVDHLIQEEKEFFKGEFFPNVLSKLYNLNKK
jgi:hypothetical protein